MFDFWGNLLNVFLFHSIFSVEIELCVHNFIVMSLDKAFITLFLRYMVDDEIFETQQQLWLAKDHNQPNVSLSLCIRRPLNCCIPDYISVTQSMESTLSLSLFIFIQAMWKIKKSIEACECDCEEMTIT